MGAGKVYWITGLSGAGKTTVGSALYDKLKQEKDTIIYLDGDILRKTVACDFGYSREERQKAGMLYARLCYMLSNLGFDIIIATIAMFHTVQDWNRENIENYYEIFLKVPMEILEVRNQKGLYTGSKIGKIKNVAGIDLEVEEPRNPKLVIYNDGRYTIKQCVDQIMQISLN